MLHRSFKPAKCKTALKLAIPRIKLMKNKREAYFKQLKRELAQLLESGQDQTARIRVEHVVREEKTVAAYSLLEIYCELIVARMPVIESQKNCPIDLKEAISSVIYASARCADIPELKDASKHFTAKYGKEFTSAALELRPNSGVGRMLVQKLSVKAPDGPTKVKILAAIAEEHNIKWDPESFGAKESKIYDDLLNGPKTEDSKILVDPPNIQASPRHYDQIPPSVQVPNYEKGPPNVQDPKHIAKSNVPESFHNHSSRSSSDIKNFNYSNSSANCSMSSGTYRSDSKAYGTENQGMEFRNSYHGNESSFSSPRKQWNMEFRDATAAAEVAAVSAELASMAARAAAELSSRGNISRQYSTESHKQPVHVMRDEEPWKHTGAASQNENLDRHPDNISSNGRNSRKYEQNDSNEQHNRAREAGNAYSNIARRSSDKSTYSSFKSTAASFNEKPSLSDQIADAYPQRNSSGGRRMENFTEVSMKRNSGESGKQFVDEPQDIKNPRNVDHHEVRVGRQSSYSSSSSSSHSQSNISTDDQDVVSNFIGRRSENNQRNSGESEVHFVNELHDTKNTDFSDYQELRFRKQSSYSSSHSRSSTSTDDHDVASNLYRQKSGNNSGKDSFLSNDKGRLQKSTKETTCFDDNAYADFDSYGSDIDEYEFDLKEEHKVPEYNMNFLSPGQRSATHPFTSTNSRSAEKNVESPEGSTSSAVPSHGDDFLATFDDYGTSLESEEELDKSEFVRNVDSPKVAEGMADTGAPNDSSVEGSKVLKFGNLTGGLRNKGYRQPPYLKISQGNGLSSGEPANGTSTRIKQSSSPAAVKDSVSSGSYNQEPYSRNGSEEVNGKLGTRASVTHVDSSDDDSEAERPKQTFVSSQDRHNEMPSLEENKRSRLRVPDSYFGSGNGDPDEDISEKSPKARSNDGFSRRTKTFPSNSRDNFQHSRLASQATSKPISVGKTYSLDGTLRSSEKEQPKLTLPGSAKSVNAQSSIEKGSPRDSASHVHPKLPDYDILTAHLNSLRKNRQ